MQREEVREGVWVRLLSDWASVPRGTTGTIGTTICNEGFRSAVMWDSYLAIPLFSAPKMRPKLILPGLASHSVLTDENLHMVEVITAEQPAKH